MTELPAHRAMVARPRRPLVAVVDDDPAVASSLEFALVVEGYRVNAYHSASDYIERQKSHVDCLIVDYKLDGMDGIAFIEELERRGALPPPLMIAANPSRRCRQWAAASGVPLVEKPLLDSALTDRIRTLISEPSKS
eukprot:gene14208-16557_t